MSTDHYYEFFDRDFYDGVWSLSWPEFCRKYRSRWATSKKYERGLYDGNSLRELILFSLEPEPPPAILEEILKHWTVQKTVRQATPQFWFISHLMEQLGAHCSAEEIPGGDVAMLISAAVSGYLAGQMSDLDLRAVLKIHSCGNPGKWVLLSAKQKKTISPITAGINYLAPIYPWQGEAACAGDSWTNCLGVRDTRRFMSFIDRAWLENWQLVPIKDPLDEQLQRPGEALRFRDFYISQELIETIKAAARFKRPSLFRQWF